MMTPTVTISQSMYDLSIFDTIYSALFFAYNEFSKRFGQMTYASSRVIVIVADGLLEQTLLFYTKFAYFSEFNQPSSSQQLSAEVLANRLRYDGFSINAIGATPIFGIRNQLRNLVNIDYANFIALDSYSLIIDSLIRDVTTQWICSGKLDDKVSTIIYLKLIYR